MNEIKDTDDISFLIQLKYHQTFFKELVVHVEGALADRSSDLRDINILFIGNFKSELIPPV